MASFTDTTPKFNPYIQQQPIEAMVAVGTQKQKGYEEGVQKIQSQIDNIAGLDVVRDVDKAYLQSKMNELGNNLRTVASGDFSNFQLVNSVSGMTKQLTRDKYIQNAVNNAGRYRKELTNLEEARKKGESSPSNEYVFNKDASSWLNSDDLKGSFTAKYDKYTNWKKNALEVIKGLTKDESITDNAFTMDSKGNLVIADAMVRTKLSGISPEKIQQALAVGLTPADFKQMGIDGRYSYASADPKAFMDSVTESYNGDYNAFRDKRNVLNNAVSTTTSLPEKAKLKEQIASIDKTLSQLKGEYENVVKSYESGDVESAKARLYTTKQMNGFSKAFAHTETSQTYEASPLADMKMRREIKNQDWKKFTMEFAQDERFHADTVAMQMADLETKKEANRLKKQEVEGGLYGGTPFSVSQEDLPKLDLAKVVAGVNTAQNSINTQDGALMKQYGKDQAWLDQQKQSWLERPTSVDPVVARHFNNTEGTRRKMESDMAMVTDINKAAVAAHGDIYKHIPTGFKGMVATIDGKKQTISAKDLVDYNAKIDKYAARHTNLPANQGGAYGRTTVVFSSEKAKKELTPKELYIFNLLKKKTANGEETLNSGELMLLDKANQIKKSVNEPYRKVMNDINDFTAKEVSKRMTVAQGMEYDFSTANAAQKTAIGARLVSLANFSETQKGGIANSPEWDAKKAKIIGTDASSIYNFKVVEGTSANPGMYEMTATGNDGTTVKARLTPEMKTKMFGNMFEASPQAQAARPYQEQMRKMGGSSTALTPGPTTIGNAYLNKTDFPSVGLYGVTGNIVSPDGGHSYSVRLNIYDPVTKKWHQDIPYPSSTLLSEEQLVPVMQRLNDAYLYESLTNKIPTSNSLKQVQNASKTPL